MENLYTIVLKDEETFTWFNCDNCHPEVDEDALRDILHGKTKSGFSLGPREQAEQAGWQFTDDGDFCLACAEKMGYLEEALEPDMATFEAAELIQAEPVKKVHVDEAPEVTEYRAEMAAKGVAIDVKNVKIPAKDPKRSLMEAFRDTNETILATAGPLRDTKVGEARPQVARPAGLQKLGSLFKKK